jgi:hypothetical protein
MRHNPESKIQEKTVAATIPIGGLIHTLHNIQSKIEVASGAATALDLLLRIIAQLEPKVQIALAKTTKTLYHKATFGQLIGPVLEVFNDVLGPIDCAKIKNCLQPRNTTVHGNFAELVIHLCGEAPGMEIDSRTGKVKSLREDDIIGGVLCVERNQGLEAFSRGAHEVADILERKILRSLGP